MGILRVIAWTVRFLAFTGEQSMNIGLPFFEYLKLSTKRSNI